MSRKDNKGRVLKSNEFQRSDGRYEYKYTDRQGQRRSVYSWRLIESDRIPEGKRKCKSLRELEGEIQTLLNNNINIGKAKTYTLDECFDEHINNRQIKERTRYMYRLDYDRHIRTRIGSKPISSLNHSTMRKCYKELIEDDGLSLVSVYRIIAMLNPIFKEAMMDNVILSNPNWKMKSELKYYYGKSQNKEEVQPLTKEQESELLSFVKDHPKHSYMYPLIYFMLRTGCRFSEARALTWDDVNFEEHYVSINHIFNILPEVGLYATPPKTKASIRKIPLLPELESMLQDLKEQQITNNVFDNVSIDGYEHLVFLTLQGNMFINQCTGRKLKAITASYNLERYPESGIEMPVLKSHMFRHTYCTRLCENDVNLKTIQSIMGHSNISVTMDIYSQVTEKKKLEDVQRVPFDFFVS